MTAVNFLLYDGNTVPSNMANYNADDLLDKILNPQIMVLNIDGVIVNKNMIKLISPVQPADKVWVNPIKVVLQNDVVFNTEDATFNADNVTLQLNDLSTSMFVIGDLVVAKSAIRMINPNE